MMDRIVVKLGGSLLHQSDWVQRFRRWRQRQAPSHMLLIVGGGEIIEGLRQLSAQHTLHEESMHWRCVRALDLTWEIARELLPEALAIDFSELEKQTAEGPNEPLLMLVRVASFYEASIPLDRYGVQSPPLNWQTTTDTIAILLGQLADAKRVVLLKSCAIEPGITLQEATQRGMIDGALVQVIQEHQTCELVALMQLDET